LKKENLMHNLATIYSKLIFNYLIFKRKLYISHGLFYGKWVYDFISKILENICGKSYDIFYSKIHGKLPIKMTTFSMKIVHLKLPIENKNSWEMLPTNILPPCFGSWKVHGKITITYRI